MTWTTDIPALSIELLDNGNLRLEDKSYSEGAIVDIHPTHLRLMAEKLGLVREVSASSADMVRDVSRYKRSLLMLRDKALELQTYMAQCSDWDHADLTAEMLRVNGIVDLLDLTCDDFEDDFTHRSREVTTSHETPAKVAPEQLTLKG